MNDKYLTYAAIFALGFLTHNFVVQQQTLGTISGWFNR